MLKVYMLKKSKIKIQVKIEYYKSALIKLIQNYKNHCLD